MTARDELERQQTIEADILAGHIGRRSHGGHRRKLGGSDKGGPGAKTTARVAKPASDPHAGHQMPAAVSAGSGGREATSDAHAGHRKLDGTAEHPGGHASGHGDMVADFRRRFWVSLALTVPVLILSPMVRDFAGQGMAPLFVAEEWAALALSSAIYFWGGWPFLTGAWPEVRSGRPGMMTLVVLAISTAYFYSAAVTLGLPGGEPFYWELATLVTIMLLGHWLEMRSVLGASRALEELVRLLPSEQ